MIALAAPSVFSAVPLLQYRFSLMKNTGLIRIYASNVMHVVRSVRLMLL